jgi:hypothetical protein
MKRSVGKDLPRARKADLVTRELPGELLVYDLRRHQAFCLNETAASVWKCCNGKRSVKELAQQLGTDGKGPVDQNLVWLALDQLEKSNLLQSAVARPKSAAQLSRRNLIRAGVAASVALPVVVAIVAPRAASAASCPGGVGTVPFSSPCSHTCQCNQFGNPGSICCANVPGFGNICTPNVPGVTCIS